MSRPSSSPAHTQTPYPLQQLQQRPQSATHLQPPTTLGLPALRNSHSDTVVPLQQQHLGLGAHDPNLLRPSRSTSSLPVTQPSAQGNRSLARAVSSGQRTGNPGPGPQPQPLASGQVNPDEQLQNALRASRYDAELEEARRSSAAAEDDRLLQLALADSQEQDTLRAQREARERQEDEESLRQVLRSSRLESQAKGKASETEVDRREREDLEIVLALSLSEGTRVRNPLGVGTSSDEFARLSQTAPSRDIQLSVPATPSLPSVTPSSAPQSPFVVTNPDDDDDVNLGPPPPAYDQLPLEQEDSYDESSSASIRLDTSLRRSLVSSSSDQSASNRRLSTLSSTARAGSFVSITSSNATVSPPASPIMTNPTQRQGPAQGYFAPASFYPAAISAAIGYPASPLDTLTPTSAHRPAEMMLPRTVLLEEEEEEEEEQQQGGVQADQGEEEDPFDERTSAVDYMYDSDGYEEEFEAQVAVPEVSLEPLAISSHQSSTTSLATSDSYYMLPTDGGLVDSSSVNAVASEQILRDIYFGFISPALAARALHPLVLQAGPFPDVAQLSSSVGPKLESEPEFQCFAVESRTWISLLQYLMWHGNSRIEAAASDLAKDKLGSGLACAVTLEFFRSFEDGTTKVRCRLDLLGANSSNSTSEDVLPPSILDPDCPNITIRLPSAVPLPLSLAHLANTLFVAHTVSRQPKRRWSTHHASGSSSANSAATVRSLKNLSTAVDLFKTLNGEVVGQPAVDVEADEGRLLSKLKLKLKRRKRAPGIVKGGADGTGHASDLSESQRDLPEGAILVTPFRLDD